MDLSKFEFPEVRESDAAFPVFNTIPSLLREAEARGFDDWNNPYHRLFSTLFFKGGQVKFKDNLDPNFKHKAWAYMCAFMQSFSPKHEHKGAVCALILSELCELK